MTVSYATGNVGIGRSPHATYKLDVEGDVASKGVKLTSDIRLKEDIKPLTGTYDKIALLQPISYKYKAPESALTEQAVASDTSAAVMAEQVNDDSFYNQTRYGFSAQDIRTVFPDLVTEDEEGLLTVDYFGLIPVMIEALKAQQVKIAELEKKVAALSAVKPKP
jgi:hypothetical protein